MAFAIVELSLIIHGVSFFSGNAERGMLLMFRLKSDIGSSPESKSHISDSNWGVPRYAIPEHTIEIFPKEPALCFALICILAIALALRLAWAFSGPPLRFDEYAGIAECLADGHGYSWVIAGKTVPTDIRAPLYPMLLAAGIKIARIFEVAVLFQAVLSTVSCFLVYVLGATLFTSKEGILGAAFSAIDFFQITMVRYLMTETLYLFFILLSQILLLRILRSEPVKLTKLVLIAYSIAITTSILTRPEAPVYFILISILIICTHGNLRMAYIKGFGFSLMLAAALLLPWMFRNYTVLGDFELSNGILVDFNMYRGLVELNGNPNGDYGFEIYEAIRSGKQPINPASSRHSFRKKVLNDVAEAVIERPGAVAIERMQNLSRALIYKGEFYFADLTPWERRTAAGNRYLLARKFLFDIVYGVLPWVLALGGSILVWRRHRTVEWLTLWVFPLSVTLLMIPLWADPRYMLPAHSLLAPLCAVSVLYVYRVSRRQLQSINSKS